MGRNNFTEQIQTLLNNLWLAHTCGELINEDNLHHLDESCADIHISFMKDIPGVVPETVKHRESQAPSYSTREMSAYYSCDAHLSGYILSIWKYEDRPYWGVKF